MALSFCAFKVPLLFLCEKEAVMLLGRKLALSQSFPNCGALLVLRGGGRGFCMRGIYFERYMGARQYIFRYAL
jgi:hypothetical protein